MVCAAIMLGICRYMPGQKGAARVMLTLRDGWKGLRKFPLFPDRAALIVSAGLLLPYSTPDFATSISKASCRLQSRASLEDRRPLSCPA